MIYTKLTKKAMKIAYAAHMGQTDRQGLPYIYHPLHLAEQMQTEDTCVAALLHDVVEDTDMTFEELEKSGFTQVQMEAVRLLTHIPKEGLSGEEEILEDYFEYVKKIKASEVARAVKLADLEHNSDLTRLDNVTDKDMKRCEKYKKAAEMLLS